jgi:hypothetical protein
VVGKPGIVPVDFNIASLSKPRATQRLFGSSSALEPQVVRIFESGCRTRAPPDDYLCPIHHLKDPHMRYACLIYYNARTLFGGSPEANAALEQCAGYDDKLKESGHFVLGEALEMPESALTVQVRNGKMSATDGPFMETKDMLGGIVLIEAHDLNDAARVAAGHPLAKIGAIEVRPLVDFSQPRPEL